MRPPRMNPDEELADLQKKYLLLEGDRKAYYETSQWTIKQNRETIAVVKNENKELRNRIQQIHSSKHEAGLKGQGDELEKTGAYVRALRKDHDDICQVGTRLQDRLSKVTDNIKDLEKDSLRATDDDSPVTRHIRLLENRLDKALIKYNEAQSIRKTYEQIVKRLREERIGFDNQLGALERTLHAKEADLEELMLMSHDATHAKEVAKAELVRVDAMLQAERQKRERELTERRVQVRARQDMAAKMEKRERTRLDIQQEAKGDLSEAQEQALRQTAVTNQLNSEANQAILQREETRITTFEEAFRKIKEATGVSDVNDVIAKFATQSETMENLKHISKDSQQKIDKLVEESASLKASMEEIKYAGGGVSGSRRMVDESESKLNEFATLMERARQRYEKEALVMIEMKAGTEHLSEKLTDVKLDQPNIPLQDDTVIDVLGQCETKLLRVIDAIADEEPSKLAQEAEANEEKQRTDMPTTNMRINTMYNPYGSDDDDDDDADDGDEGDVPDREDLKRSSEDKTSGKKKKRGVMAAGQAGFDKQKTGRRASVKGGGTRAKPSIA
ncbi:outer dynein arm-docking complex subunit 3 [Pycnococcus provasolii]